MTSARVGAAARGIPRVVAAFGPSVVLWATRVPAVGINVTFYRAQARPRPGGTIRAHTEKRLDSGGPGTG